MSEGEKVRGEGVGMARVEKEGSAGNRHPEEHIQLVPGRGQGAGTETERTDSD